MTEIEARNLATKNFTLAHHQFTFAKEAAQSGNNTLSDYCYGEAVKYKNEGVIMAARADQIANSGWFSWL